MKQEKFFFALLASLAIGLVILAAYASYRFIEISAKMSILEDLHARNIRRLQDLEAANNSLQYENDVLRAADSTKSDILIQMQQEERAEYFQAVQDIASSFHGYNENDVELMHYQNTDLGFKMSYPASWGKLTIDIFTHENKPELVAKGYEVSGYFEDGSVKIGAISLDYEDASGGRGLSTAESIVWYTPEESPYFRKDEVKPDETKMLDGNKEMALWYSWPIGWDTDAFVMALRVPVQHPDLQHIAFIGPAAQKGIMPEDVKNFLEMARTFEFIQ